MAGSLLDELRAMEDHLRAHSTKTLTVPGSGGKLAVRYRPPADPDQLLPVMAAINAGGALTADQQAQLLVDCCDEVLRHDPATGEETPFDADGQLRFDAGDDRWGAGVTTARQCVHELFKTKQQPLAMSRHVNSLIDWLQGLDAEIAARTEGNSASAET